MRVITRADEGDRASYRMEFDQHFEARLFRPCLKKHKQIFFRRPFLGNSRLFGSTLGSFLDDFGMTLGSILDHFGMTLGSFWDHFGMILESSWAHFGVTLASLWDHFGVTLASLWDPCAAQG